MFSLFTNEFLESLYGGYSLKCYVFFSNKLTNTLKNCITSEAQRNRHFDTLLVEMEFGTYFGKSIWRHTCIGMFMHMYVIYVYIHTRKYMHSHIYSFGQSPKDFFTKNIRTSLLIRTFIALF